MASVTFERVEKHYDAGTVAVRGVDLSVRDGEFLVLLGPSGCGKSSMLRMMAGLESVSRGSIYIGDSDVTDAHPSQRDVAMVFQSYALYPHMTVRKNLSYGLRRRKIPKAQIEKQVAETASLLELDQLLERLPAQLSGGQRQRVALGRAIVRHPSVFLLDEPLSNLDAKLRVQMREELMALHRRLGVTTIYVTHDQVEAMTMGDRIVVMQDGEIQQAGTPLELYQRPANRFVGTFLGSPVMNELIGRIRAAGTHSRFSGEGVSFELGLASPQLLDRDVVVGVRPQSLQASDTTNSSDRVVFGRGQVEVVEHLGSESFAVLKLGKRRVTAAIEAAKPCSVGEMRDVHAPADALLFFDAASGQRIDVGTADVWRENAAPADSMKH